MSDPSNPLQQEAIGILGVNLIYAVFYQLQTKESFFKNMLRNSINGSKSTMWNCVERPSKGGTSARSLPIWWARVLLKLSVFCPAVHLSRLSKCSTRKRSCSRQDPSNTWIPTHAAIHERLLTSAIQQLRGELDQKAPAPTGFFCLSAMALTEADAPPGIPELLERIDALRARGGAVLLFRDRELYSMTTLVNRYTKEPVRFVVGLSLLVRVWGYRYRKLAGSFLEALSRLFAQNVRIYAYPMNSRDLQQSVESVSSTGWHWTDTNGWVSALQLHPPTAARSPLQLCSC